MVTFRVSSEIYDQVGGAKVKTGLSNADLVKPGAGIAQEEIKAKLAEASGLENRLSQLKAAVRQTEQQLNKALTEEDYCRAPGVRLTARCHGYTISDNSDEGQDASLQVETGNAKQEGRYGKWQRLRGNSPRYPHGSYMTHRFALAVGCAT